MLILLTLILIFLILLWVRLWIEKKDKYGEHIGVHLCIFLLGLFIGGAILWLPISRLSSAGECREFEATKETVAAQRKMNITEYERVQLTKEIIDKNAWLKSHQYYRKNPWTNWYISPKVLELTPIQ